MTDKKDKLLIPTREAFRRLSIGRTTGYRLIREGWIPTVRLATGALRVPVRALEERIAEAATAEADEPAA